MDEEIVMCACGEVVRGKHAPLCPLVLKETIARLEEELANQRVYGSDLAVDLVMERHACALLRVERDEANEALALAKGRLRKLIEAAVVFKRPPFCLCSLPGCAHCHAEEGRRASLSDAIDDAQRG